MISKCPVCNQQKGKRKCPVLNKIICPRCCFQYRSRERNCPETCQYLHKSKQLLKQKEVSENITFYRNMDRIFDSQPELFVPLIDKLTHAIVEVDSRDNFLEDIHVIEALHRVFDDLKNRIDGRERNKEVLLNRIGTTQTALEECIFQFKINNKDFTDKQVLVALNVLSNLYEIEKEKSSHPKHFITFLKSMLEENTRKNQESSIILEGR